MNVVPTAAGVVASPRNALDDAPSKESHEYEQHLKVAELVEATCGLNKMDWVKSPLTCVWNSRLARLKNGLAFYALMQARTRRRRIPATTFLFYLCPCATSLLPPASLCPSLDPSASELALISDLDA